MSGDEGFVTVVSVFVGLPTLCHWYYLLGKLGRGFGAGLLAAVPVAALGFLYFVLKNFASADVRDSGTYIGMYIAVGAGWFGLSMLALPMLGFSARDDALERRNAGAGFLAAGAMLGLMFCFAGGNVGDGPGWWVVLFAAGLAGGTLCFLWVALNWITPVADRVTIDRDGSSGVRAGAYFVCAGLILGRAVAGNWISLDATLKDFVARGWPALVVWALALGCELFFKIDYKRARSFSFTEAWLPAMAMALVAAYSLFALGGFE